MKVITDRKMKVILIFTVTALMAVFSLGCSYGAGDGTGGNSQGHETKHLDGDLTAIIEKIYEMTDFDLGLTNIPVDLTDSEGVRFNLGLENASKLKEAILSEAMISSQAYSMILARVNDEDDAGDVAEEMFSGVDQRKWVCVEADDLQVATYGDAILLVMIDSNIDGATAKDLVDAFGEICGGEFDINLTN